jgi:hypothetical protein
MRTLLATLSLAAAACSSPSQPVASDPCWTPGATYSCALSQRSGGSCGTLPSQRLSVAADGGVGQLAGIKCTSSRAAGCSLESTGCQEDGFSASLSLQVADGGAAASGTLQVSGPLDSCSSTYDVHCTR